MASEQPQEAVPVVEPVAQTVQESTPTVESAAAAAPSADATAEPLSKNARKRLLKQQKWEQGKDDRRQKRKEKRQERRDRHKTEKEALIAQGVDPSTLIPARKVPATLAAVTLLIDCDFEQYMTDKERISLSSQVTRAYSDNRNAKFSSHLWVSGFQGRLRERFRVTLQDQQKSWKGMYFYEGNFLECADKARDIGSTGQVIPPLQRSLDNPVPWVRDETDPFPLTDEEPPLNEAYKDVVYLSSDSPYTLERLEPSTTYVIGGLVDKNREKGLCYKRARERGIRTARLPIGQFMVMQSRTVLATNHVVEIMLKWLEFEDWGKAFMAVIPKRKGGKLIGEADEDADEREEDVEDKPTQQEQVTETNQTAEPSS